MSKIVELAAAVDKASNDVPSKQIAYEKALDELNKAKKDLDSTLVSVQTAKSALLAELSKLPSPTISVV